jgi:serine/threonine protein kinase
MNDLMRDQIFISYAHEDREWLAEFLKILQPVQDRGLVKVWSDLDLDAGDDWRQGIRDALAEARTGILLVTPDFLGSAFIRDEELRGLLAKLQSGRLRLYWVPISASLYDYTELEHVQAASDPEVPLETLAKPERRRVITQICRRILEPLGQLPALTRDDRLAWRQRVSEKLGDKYEILEEVGSGLSSIVYRARMTSVDRVVAVKTLVSSALQPGLEERFRDQIEIAYRLESPAYIRVSDHFLEGAPHCVVTEYVEGRRLDWRMEDAALPVRQVRQILLELAVALHEAHQQSYLHEGLTPSNLFIESPCHPRISAFRFLSLGANDQTYGSFDLSGEACTYMSPEEFEGQLRTPRSDQYALGLLGYELLSGKRVPPVLRPADLVSRPALYRMLASEEAWSTRCPALGGIVSRMLRVVPEQRWDSLGDVVFMLEQVVVTDGDRDALRSTALTSYSRFQFGEGERRFCERFYARLFELAPEVKVHFASTDMSRQVPLLGRAIRLLLDYDPRTTASERALAQLAERHARFMLTPAHLDAFRRALLATLQDLGETDVRVVDAWDGLLGPSLQYVGQALHSPGSIAPV